MFQNLSFALLALPLILPWTTFRPVGTNLHSLLKYRPHMSWNNLKHSMEKSSNREIHIAHAAPIPLIPRATRSCARLLRFRIVLGRLCISLDSFLGYLVSKSCNAFFYCNKCFYFLIPSINSLDKLFRFVILYSSNHWTFAGDVITIWSLSFFYASNRHLCLKKLQPFFSDVLSRPILRLVSLPTVSGGLSGCRLITPSLRHLHTTNGTGCVCDVQGW